jgi:hypothetical protein
MGLAIHTAMVLMRIAKLLHRRGSIALNRLLLSCKAKAPTLRRLLPRPKVVVLIFRTI